MDGWIWIAIYAGLFFVMMRYGCGAHMMGHGHSQHGDEDGHERHESHRAATGQYQAALKPPKNRVSGTFVDPVCGMPVPRDQGYGKMYEAVPYRFCSRGCLDKFDDDAERYVHKGLQHVA